MAFNLERYIPEHFKDKSLGKFQRKFKELIDKLVKIEILNGLLIQDISIVGGGPGIALKHKLDRDWIGYIVVNQNIASDITTINTNNRNISLNLRASQNVTFDLWVF